jgi:hypothetical protein
LILFTGTAGSKLVTIASVFPENTDFLTRDITAFDKSKMEQISKPFRIFGIIFVAFHCLYLFGIGNDNMDFIFQKVKDRNPVFTYGFHTDIMAIIVEKPLTELPHNKTKSFNNS